MRNFLFALAALSAFAGPAMAQTTDAPISTAVHGEEGEYLVDASGHALYTFKADTQGSQGSPGKSACEDDCLGVWPPLLVNNPPVGDAKIRAELLGTISRSDGSLQVTYNDWPLYFYAEDIEPTDIKGNDIESFGEDWYLIGPNGNRSDRDDKKDRRG
jgi:predicted lipoprotein with Yx(FWY)xxD motif